VAGLSIVPAPNFKPALPYLLALAAGLVLYAGPAHASSGEVAVDFKNDGRALPHVIKTTDVETTIARLRGRTDVRYAVRNVKASATQAGRFIPNDPGRAGEAGGWRKTQWYLTGPASINAPEGWANLIAAGRRGARDVRIAILDSGVAYKAAGVRPASVELPRKRFIAGYDFIDNDPSPTDEYGHGTMVAALVGGETDNKVGLTGVAYRSRIIPVRVLDSEGNGDATTIARGIRYAVLKRAQLINLSLEFPEQYTARDIPQLIDALRFARRRGVTTIVAAGNSGLTRLPYPGRASTTIAVGATTEHGCIADYSNGGTALDVVAPGGGADGEFADPGCTPTTQSGRGITQLTLIGRRLVRLGLASRDGTSMAAPLVTGTAAGIIASGVLGPTPSPAAIKRRLQKTARDLGPSGRDSRYGAGVIDFAAATRAVDPTQ